MFYEGPMKTLLIAALLFCSQSCLRAGLVWESKQLEFHPALGVDEVKAEFHFTNTDNQTVTFESLEPGCGCTTVKVEKMEWAPGEKGSVTAVFHVGERTGIQNKPIRVKVKDERELTILTMVVDLPELMEIKPRFVWWGIGDEGVSKTIELNVFPGNALQITRVLSTDPGIDAVLATVEEGKTYKIIVTPKQIKAPVIAVLSIEGVMAPGSQKIFTAYAQVK